MLLIYYHNVIVNKRVTCGEHWLNMCQERHPVVKNTSPIVFIGSRSKLCNLIIQQQIKGLNNWVSSL